MPAPDDDWGTGICDLNVEQLERQLQKLERGERPKMEDCAIAAENPAAGKARGRNRLAKRSTLKAPAMPCVTRKEGPQGHRTRLNNGSAGNLHDLGIPAMVARPVSKDEIKMDKGNLCSAAIKTEWENLKAKGVFDFSTVRPWHEAAQDARRHGRTEHMGRAFGIMVEKNYELPEDDPRRKMKYRVVSQGNNVHTASWETACFEDAGSSPCSMEAGNVVECYWCSQEMMVSRPTQINHISNLNGLGQLCGSNFQKKFVRLNGTTPTAPQSTYGR